MRRLHNDKKWIEEPRDEDRSSSSLLGDDRQQCGWCALVEWLAWEEMVALPWAQKEYGQTSWTQTYKQIPAKSIVFLQDNTNIPGSGIQALHELSLHFLLPFQKRTLPTGNITNPIVAAMWIQLLSSHFRVSVSPKNWTALTLNLKLLIMKCVCFYKLTKVRLQAH